MASRTESRKRLYPWLKKKVDAEEFGLKWVDRDQQYFSIPWMHKSNRAWNEKRCQIFKEWAKYTNKYREGEPEDWPGWKQRLRSALNKLCEHMHHLNNLDSTENPYRVYRFLTDDEKLKDYTDSCSSTGGSPSCSQPTDDSPSSSQPMNFNPSSSQLPFHALDHNLEAPFFNIPAIVGPLQDYNGMNILPGVSQPSVIPNIDFISDAVNQEQNIDETGNIPSLSSDLASIETNHLISNCKFPSEEINCYKGDIKRPTIHYKIYFLDEKVTEGCLYDNGAHFYFGRTPDFSAPLLVFGPQHLEQIPFPDLTNLKRSINSEQQKLMQDILLKMNRGFLIQCHEGDIYAQRLCQTRIYAMNYQIGSQVLDRASKTTTKLFNFTKFVEKLNTSPGDIKITPETVLTLGQELKSPDSFRKLLMRVELVHLEAEELVQKVCPSSIRSNLMFSDPDSGDRYLQERMHNLNLS